MEQLTIRNLFDLSKTEAHKLFEPLTYPWEALPLISAFITELGESLGDEYKRIGDNVWVHKSATVAPSAFIAGPTIICENAEIRHCAYIRGSAFVGKGAIVGNSTELKNVVLFDGVQVPHYNYVGDSILGYKAHMGAGSITSNVKSDKTLVTIKTDGAVIETGLKKMGAMLGDNVEVGCNSVLNPGTIVGRGASVYPLSMVRGYVPEGYIFKNQHDVVKRK